LLGEASEAAKEILNSCQKTMIDADIQNKLQDFAMLSAFSSDINQLEKQFIVDLHLGGAASSSPLVPAKTGVHISPSPSLTLSPPRSLTPNPTSPPPRVPLPPSTPDVRFPFFFC